MSGHHADVVVVGAGPAGSATAAHLAAAGWDVLLLDRERFPREKVCGDGLTPRAVGQLHALGVDTGPASGWVRTRGLRIVGGGRAVELPWPAAPGVPGYGLVRPRADLDTLLLARARAAGARVREGFAVTRLRVAEPAGTVTGVAGHPVDLRGRRAGGEQTVRARLVVAADGAAGRLALADGRHRRRDRPLGVAARAYHTSPRHDDPWLETWLELRDVDGRLLPGYGWVFGLADGTVNVGVGLLDRAAAPGLGARDLLARWMAGLPPGHGVTDGSRLGAVRGAALPMGLNRAPAYARGLLLVGDAGGLVNPFTGEGIAAALESGALAARTVDAALRARGPAGRERALHGYPAALAARYGGYYAAGRVFLRLMRDQRVARLGTGHGTHHPRALHAVLRVLADVVDPHSPDAVDRVLAAALDAVPAGRT